MRLLLFICLLWFVRHRNCPSRPSYAHQCMCEAENDPASATTHHLHRYNRHLYLNSTVGPLSLTTGSYV